MNYLFVSEDCINCFFITKILSDKDSTKWTRCLTLVYVKSDNEGNLISFINNKDMGKAPVSRVPALFLRSRDELIVGGEEVFEELSNANWFC